MIYRYLSISLLDTMCLGHFQIMSMVYLKVDTDVVVLSWVTRFCTGRPCLGDHAPFMKQEKTNRAWYGTALFLNECKCQKTNRGWLWIVSKCQRSKWKISVNQIFGHFNYKAARDEFNNKDKLPANLMGASKTVSQKIWQPCTYSATPTS
jgi:hypothetical protein